MNESEGGLAGAEEAVAVRCSFPAAAAIASLSQQTFGTYPSARPWRPRRRNCPLPPSLSEGEVGEGCAKASYLPSLGCPGCFSSQSQWGLEVLRGALPFPQVVVLESLGVMSPQVLGVIDLP